MDDNDLLLIVAMAVLALMVVHAFLKHRVRRTGLNRYAKRMARRRYRATPPPRTDGAEPGRDPEPPEDD